MLHFSEKELVREFCVMPVLVTRSVSGVRRNWCRCMSMYKPRWSENTIVPNDRMSALDMNGSNALEHNMKSIRPYPLE